VTTTTPLKLLDFLRLNAGLSHRLGYTIDDAEVVPSDIQSHTVPRVLDDVPGRREAAAGHHSLPAGGWKAPTPAQPGLGIRNKGTSVTLGPRVSQAKLSRWLIQRTN
jgi:hypothetical protein